MYSCLPSPNIRLQLLPFSTVPKLRVGLPSHHRLALARMSTSTQGKWRDWPILLWVLNATAADCCDAGINGHASPSAATPPTQTPVSAQSASSPEDHAPLRTPLSIVVTDAVKRWYIDTNKEAVKGDVVCSFGVCPQFCKPLVLCTSYGVFCAAETASPTWSNALGRLWL